MIYKNKIDELVSRREQLLIKKQQKKDKMFEQNSIITTKIKKLENLSYRKKDKTDAEVAEIEREINKTERLIEIEKDYVNSLFKKDKTDFEQN